MAESSTSPAAPESASTLPSVMPDSSIAAATAALTQALEAANIVKEDEPAAESEDEARKGDIDGDKTVFDDKEAFNVKHPLYSPWTLWYESDQTKDLPKLPVPGAAAGSAPSTPAPGAHGGWMDNVRPVVAFNSVEEFWGLYNNIVPASQLPKKANYYLFKESIIPAWEDAANHDGGKWSIQVPRDKTGKGIDQMWMYTMLAAIGETFETPVQGSEEEAKLKAAGPPTTPVTSDLITGVILSARPHFYRLAIWTRHAPATTAAPAPGAEDDPVRARILAVGRHFKQVVLGYGSDDKLMADGRGYQTEIEFISHSDSERKDKKHNKIVI